MALPQDLRLRIVDLVASGISRCEAARQFKVSASSAVRFVKQAAKMGHVDVKKPKKRKSKLDPYRTDIIGWIGEQPDLTLSELCTAYRSAANETYLDKHGKLSRIHYKKPKGKPMPRNISRSNAAKSRIRARVEHVFAEQKGHMGLYIRTIGIKRAEAAITLVNMAYNMKRWCWLEGKSAPA